MRSKEQFKTYVYEKAETALLRNKKMYAIALRSVVTLSFFAIVGGVMLYSNGTNDVAMFPEARSVKEAENCSFYGEIAGSSVLDAALDCATAGTETDISAKGGSSILYSTYTEHACELQDGGLDAVRGGVYRIAESAESYAGELENIDFTKSIALVFEDCPSILNCDIQYAEELIIVKMTVEEDMSKALSTYTVLLNKSKYNGQPIEVVFE